MNEYNVIYNRLQKPRLDTSLYCELFDFKVKREEYISTQLIQFSTP